MIYGGATAYSMAMHIHSSFSEQSGSMDGQLYQAAQNSVDVLWWSDHDWRMSGLGYRAVVHFTGTTEGGATGQGGNWTWQLKHTAGLKSYTAQIVSSPYSPNDTVASGAAYLAAAARLGKTGSAGLYANTQPADYTARDNLAGQSLSIDVLLNPGWTRGYLELGIQSSTHPSGGLYSLSYRMTPGSGPVTQSSQGSLGIVTIPVSSPWQTVTVTPENDIAAIWPSVDARDFALWNLQLNAVSTGEAVSGYFDYLRFARTLTAGELFAQQQSMMTALASTYPGVTQEQGLEVSWQNPHLNWFGGNPAIPGYQGVTATSYPAYVANTIIPQIHGNGGLVSYNHPYGTKGRAALPGSAQDTLMSHTAVSLLGNKALGADLLEVGYVLRAGVDLAHHVGLWDVMSRNSLFLTGNGTSDDHFGVNWAALQNNWVTSAWTASTGQGDLLAALAAGRAWCGDLGYAGALDMLVDGSCPMGSVSLSSASSRQLTVTATGIPAGGSVQVLQGTVDYAGTADPSPDTNVIASYPDTVMAAGGGQASMPVDTTGESFVRAQVLDASGAVVALGNPAWMLHNVPPNGIPAPRQTA